MSREVRYFGVHREPAVIVEDFGELKVGMVVWRASCPACGRDHRALATALTPSELCRAGEPTFDYRPATSCGFHSLCRCTIAKRQLFRVIDEPPSKAETRTRGRKLVTS